jgi:hypothetical protein
MSGSHQGWPFNPGYLELGVKIFINGVSGEGTFGGLPGPVRNIIMENAPAMAAQISALNHLLPAGAMHPSKPALRSFVLMMSG